MTRRLLLTLLGTAIAVLGVAVPAAAGSTTATTIDGISPPHPRVGAHITVRGTLTSNGAPLAGKTVDVSRTGTSGSPTFVSCTGGPATTDSAGHYECTDDQPAVRGDVAYQASFSGDASDGASISQKETVHVSRAVATLRVVVDRAHATAGDRVHVTAEFRSTSSTAEQVTLYAKPYRQLRRKVTAGDANAATDGGHGVSARVTVHRRTTFIAIFRGDDAFRPVTSSRLVHVRALVGESLHRSYRRSGDVRLYHEGVNPALVARLQPALRHACIYFRAQRHYAGGWHTTAVSHCVRTDGRGLALGVLRGDHVVGEPYRLRAEWRGTRAVEARHGAWLKLRFRH